MWYILILKRTPQSIAFHRNAAREMRYEWFEKLRQECDASVIAVAHHRDDSVETFLLNLIRGTGINGLKGIAPLNGHIVRPLLNVSRQDILQYLEHLHQDYVTDSTNLQDEYMRNKIRLNILPMLGELIHLSVRVLQKQQTDWQKPLSFTTKKWPRPKTEL